jgi:hypothetical protein
MSVLAFQAESGSAEIRVESALELRIANGELFAGGPRLASYDGGCWHIGSQALERIACIGEIFVRFEGRDGKPRRAGPFADFSLAGDVASAAGRTLARYEPRENAWRFAESGTAPKHAPAADLGRAILVPQT